MIITSPRLSAVRFALALLACSFTAQAWAQLVPVPPESPQPDRLGVDLAGGQWQVVDSRMSLGVPPDSGISYTRRNFATYEFSSNVATMLGPNYVPYGVTWRIGPSTYTFTGTASNFTPPTTVTSIFGDGATLTGTCVINCGLSPITLTERDGTVDIVGGSGTVGIFSTVSGGIVPVGWPVSITKPDGRAYTTYAKSGTYTGTNCNPCTVYRLQSVTDNLGFQLKFDYQTNALSASTYAAWKAVKAVHAINNAVEYCDPNADSCALLQSWPQVQYSATPGSGPFVVTDPVQGQTTYTWVGGPKGPRLMTVQRSGTATPGYSFTYSAQSTAYLFDFVASATVPGETPRTYTFNISGTTPAFITGSSSTDSLSRTRSVTLDYTTGRVLSDTDALGRKTTFTPDSFHRITDVTFPEGNKDHYDYDSRGNVLLKTSIPKPGSGLANVVVQAVYPVNCTNPKTCNQPASVIDARGNQTDLTYDSAHGGILTKTLPPDVNGIRPQTRYQYSQLYAWKANASGIYSQASAPVWRLTSETYCRTTAATGGSCAGGAADEVVTTYEYQVGNSAKGSNVLLIGIAVTADGKTLRTCYGYDKWARRISETQPNANLASCQ